MIPKDSALLVIDITNHCCSERNEVKERKRTYNRIRKMVPKLIDFIEEYRSHDRPVIFTRCVKWDKEHVAPNIRELYKNPDNDYYTKDRTGFSEEFFEIKPKKDDMIITKDSYDAFTNPELDRVLKRLKIKQLIVTGVLGDACVNATIQGGFSRGYSLIMLKDLIEASDDEEKQELVRLLKKNTWPQLYGKTMTSKELLRE